jgi:hypothetical protein
MSPFKKSIIGVCIHLRMFVLVLLCEWVGVGACVGAWVHGCVGMIISLFLFLFFQSYLEFSFLLYKNLFGNFKFTAVFGIVIYVVQSGRNWRNCIA